MKTYPIDFVGFTSYLMSMYIRKITRKKDGKTHAYWALVESRRTERGPRQHVVAYLGEMDAAGRLGVQKAAEGRSDHQADLYENVEPEWVEVNVRGIRTEREIACCGQMPSSKTNIENYDPFPAKNLS